ncbi:unnamed protein product [Closterium sp. Yama58-4]|nr:unnamed protein product [Closterium sp. Yama58-4]
MAAISASGGGSLPRKECSLRPSRWTPAPFLSSAVLARRLGELGESGTIGEEEEEHAGEQTGEQAKEQAAAEMPPVASDQPNQRLTAHLDLSEVKRQLQRSNERTTENLKYLRSRLHASNEWTAKHLKKSNQQTRENLKHLRNRLNASNEWTLSHLKKGHQWTYERLRESNQRTREHLQHLADSDHLQQHLSHLEHLKHLEGHLDVRALKSRLDASNAKTRAQLRHLGINLEHLEGHLDVGTLKARLDASNAKTRASLRRSGRQASHTVHGVADERAAGGQDGGDVSKTASSASAKSNPTRNPYLSGNFRPVGTEELQELDCAVITLDFRPVATSFFLATLHLCLSAPLCLHQVIGQIPPGLRGRFIRNGPNPQLPPSSPALYHWFDGDGMVHSVNFHPPEENFHPAGRNLHFPRENLHLDEENFHSSRVSYGRRYIRTTGWQEERAAGRTLFGGLQQVGLGASHLLLAAMNLLGLRQQDAPMWNMQVALGASHLLLAAMNLLGLRQQDAPMWNMVRSRRGEPSVAGSNEHPQAEAARCAYVEHGGTAGGAGGEPSALAAMNILRLRQQDAPMWNMVVQQVRLGPSHLLLAAMNLLRLRQLDAPIWNMFEEGPYFSSTHPGQYGPVWSNQDRVQQPYHPARQSPPLFILPLSFSALPSSPRPPHQTKNVSNNHFIQHAGRLLSLWEAGLPYSLDPSTLDTKGVHSFDDTWRSGMTAHPKVDPVTNHMMIYGYNLTHKPYLRYGVVDPSGALIHATDLDLPHPVMMHDFAIAQHYSIFLDFPLRFQLDKVIQSHGKAKPFVFDPSKPSRIGVLPRFGSNPDICWFTVAPGFCLHVVNAFEEPSSHSSSPTSSSTSPSSASSPSSPTPHSPPPAIILRVIRFPAFSALGLAELADELACDEVARLHEYRLDLQSGAVEERPLCKVCCDFPSINPNFTGRPHRFAYSARFTAQPGPGTTVPSFNAIMKHDFQQGTYQVHSLPPGRFCGEPVFAPRHHFQSSSRVQSGEVRSETVGVGGDTVGMGAEEEDDGWVVGVGGDAVGMGAEEEDDGWVLAHVWDEEEMRSEVIVLDAMNLDKQPLARVILPKRVPYGFHGTFLPD